MKPKKIGLLQRKMSETNQFISGEKELSKYAPMILDQLHHKKIWFVHGAMGSGKTSLIKAIVHTLKSQDLASSPTFSIIQQYSIPENPWKIKGIYHMDLYRLETLDQAINVAIEDHFRSAFLCILEWPELVRPILQTDEIAEINIEVLDKNQRSYTLKA
ncbi:MAG: tRNA (adenosine(37)-N6)-threonylcarbamoyltransferase complex ATPase subunit type 1 TsaE [Bacteroidota bacterium]|nr:tRNA (adenosine(37)-N6)-threonylcarbamoyltransferase complex ATPase subunit type 1 TsaE [Bacteroidota bacterium]